MRVCIDFNFERFAKKALYWVVFIPGVVILLVTDSNENPTCKKISMSLYKFENWVWYQ